MKGLNKKKLKESEFDWATPKRGEYSIYDLRDLYKDGVRPKKIHLYGYDEDNGRFDDECEATDFYIEDHIESNEYVMMLKLPRKLFGYMGDTFGNYELSDHFAVQEDMTFDILDEHRNLNESEFNDWDWTEDVPDIDNPESWVGNVFGYSDSYVKSRGIHELEADNTWVVVNYVPNSKSVYIRMNKKNSGTHMTYVDTIRDHLNRGMWEWKWDNISIKESKEDFNWTDEIPVALEVGQRFDDIVGLSFSISHRLGNPRLFSKGNNGYIIVDKVIGDKVKVSLYNKRTDKKYPKPVYVFTSELLERNSINESNEFDWVDTIVVPEVGDTFKAEGHHGTLFTITKVTDKSIEYYYYSDGNKKKSGYPLKHFMIDIKNGRVTIDKKSINESEFDWAEDIQPYKLNAEDLKVGSSYIYHKNLDVYYSDREDGDRGYPSWLDSYDGKKFKVLELSPYGLEGDYAVPGDEYTEIVFRWDDSPEYEKLSYGMGTNFFRWAKFTEVFNNVNESNDFDWVDIVSPLPKKFVVSFCDMSNVEAVKKLGPVVKVIESYYNISKNYGSRITEWLPNSIMDEADTYEHASIVLYYKYEEGENWWGEVDVLEGSWDFCIDIDLDGRRKDGYTIFTADDILEKF